MPPPLHLRVFISSPGDVADERHLVRRLLKEELPYDPLLRGKVTLDPVSWDDPAAPTPMPANITPQEAVNRFGPKPSECNIVIVILWSRLGTHLDLSRFQKSNGEPYLSGTEYEYEEAAGAEKRPYIFVYRRTDKVLIDADDPQLAAKLEQRRKAQAFFDRFKNLDGSYRSGFTDYATPSDFVSRLENDLKSILRSRLEAAPPAAAVVESQQEVSPLWTGSPYPGLRSFDITEEVIFFGRGRETDALIARLRDPNQRFLAVVGASGSGKSSLVRAGLLPRLQQGAIEGSRHWRVLTLTPSAADGNPFLALALELARELPSGSQQSREYIAKELAKEPQRITDYAAKVLAGQPPGTALVLFVDQLEKLFTLTATGFFDLLAHAAGDPRLRVLTTLRADFFSQAVAEPALRPLLQAPAGTYPLAPPDPLALAEMIRRPAERAGLEIEGGVVNEILKDAGTNPGALPLVAFCLQQLYELYDQSQTERMTLKHFEDMGRLRGAIRNHAEKLLRDLQEEGGEHVLPTVFARLVYVNDSGNAIPQSAPRSEFDRGSAVKALIDKLIDGRLLVCDDRSQRPARMVNDGQEQNDGEDSKSATVQLAHAALLEEWPPLRKWKNENRSYMLLVAELKRDAKEWKDSQDKHRKAYSQGSGDRTILRSRDRPATVARAHRSEGNKPQHRLWTGQKLNKANEIIKRRPDYLGRDNTEISYVKQFIKASNKKRRSRIVFISSVPVAMLVFIAFSVSPKRTMRVGSFTKNDFGLYDVLGNVWEWNQDCWVNDYSKAPPDGSPWTSPDCEQYFQHYVLRGGSWDNHEKWKIRSAYRFSLPKDDRERTVGFRVARELAGKEQKYFQDPNHYGYPTPEMVVIQGGQFMMGSPPEDSEALQREKPQHLVTIKSFAMGRYEVTFAEWDACVAAGGCKSKGEGYKPPDEGWGRDRRPVINVSWDDAHEYIKWLTSVTNGIYRLPSEAEWEYAARASRPGSRPWGNEVGEGNANCAVCSVVRWKQTIDWLGFHMEPTKSVQIVRNRDGRPSEFFDLFFNPY